MANFFKRFLNLFHSIKVLLKLYNTIDVIKTKTGNRQNNGLFACPSFAVDGIKQQDEV